MICGTRTRYYARAMPERYIVVGGGLAGLTTVIKLAEAGKHVDVFSIVPGVPHDDEKLYEGLGTEAFLFYTRAFGPSATGARIAAGMRE